MSSGFGSPGRCTRWRKNSRFPFGPGSPGVYDADRDRTPGPCGCDDALDNFSLHLGIADDALRNVAPPRLELRLHEDERLQQGAASASTGGSAFVTLMNETSQTTSSGENGAPSATGR